MMRPLDIRMTWFVAVGSLFLIVSPGQVVAQNDPPSYRIVSKFNVNSALDVEKGKTDDGTSVLIWGFHAAANQRWRPVMAKEGWLKIVSLLDDNKVLQAKDAGTEDATPVVIGKYTGDEHQQWKISAAGDGYVMIMNRKSLKVLDLRGGKGEPALHAVLRPKGDAPSQLWRLFRLDRPNTVQVRPDDKKDEEFKKGREAFNRSDYDLAIPSLMRVIARDRDHQQAHYYLAVCYKDKGFKENDLGHRGKAKDHFDQGIRHASEAIRLDSKDIDAYSVRGHCYWNKGDNENAIADYTRAVELDPKNAQNYEFRANVYKGTYRLKNAIADFSKAIELDPQNPQRYRDRSSAYNASNLFTLAQKDLNKAKSLTKKK